jgi:Spy/CpxP family protein refolding chaperone
MDAVNTLEDTMTLYPIRGAAVAILAACLLAPAVQAQPMPPGGPDAFERGPGVAPFLRDLDLSEAQQDRVFAILHVQAPKRRDLEKAERKAHDALHAMASGAQLDGAAARTQAQALGQAIAAQELLHLRTEAQLMAVLTAEQRTQLREGPDSRPPRAGGKDRRERREDREDREEGARQ